MRETRRQGANTCRWKDKAPRPAKVQRGFGNNGDSMTQLELHPLCTLFPRLSGGDFDGLVADIKANGLRQPIVTHGGMILDGGNRYRACIEAGIKPKTVKFDGDNIVSFVLSANLHRRHMSPGQQAAIVASAQDWAKAQVAGSNQHKPKSDSGSATLHHLDSAKSRAAESGASLRTQKMADKVAKADPGLAREVAHGKTTLPKAVAKVEGKSTKKPAPKKPKKSQPTVESLQAENDALREELSVMHDNNRELASLLESYDSATSGEHEYAKALATVKAQLRTVEATRDQWMTTAGELRREVRALQRKLGARQ